MAIDFPSSPSVNQTYTFGSQTWVWTGTAWNLVVSQLSGPIGPTGPTGASSNVTGPTGAKGRFTVQADTPPANPIAGDAWFNSTNGQIFVYYDDGTSAAWVESASSNIGLQGNPGPTGPTGATHQTLEYKESPAQRDQPVLQAFKEFKDQPDQEALTRSIRLLMQFLPTT